MSDNGYKRRRKNEKKMSSQNVSSNSPSVSSGHSRLSLERRRDNRNRISIPRRQGLYWIATIPRDTYSWPDELPAGIVWMAGQLEQGQGGYEHFQFVFCTSSKTSLAGIKKILPAGGHYELTRSSSANDYCGKPESRIDGPWELGARPIKRNDPDDWERVWGSARTGDYLSVIN